MADHARHTLEMGLVGIGLILVLGVILGADVSGAYVTPLDLSPLTFLERSRSGLARSNANRVSP